MPVNRQVAEVLPDIADQPESLFPNAIGVHIAGLPLRKRIAVHFDQAVTMTNWIRLPFTLAATFPRFLFPRMRGKVEISSAAPGVAKVSLDTAYTPPLGKVGERLDELGLYRVATRSVVELAEAIAARLRKAAS